MKHLNVLFLFVTFILCNISSLNALDNISEFPYLENFDSFESPDLPAGWTAIVNAQSNAASVETKKRLSSAPSSPNVLLMKNGSAHEGFIGVILPQMQTLSHKKISFMGNGKTNYVSKIQLGSVASIDNLDSYQAITTLDMPGNYDNVQYQTDNLDSDNTYLVIRLLQENNLDRVYLDNFKIEETVPTIPENIVHIGNENNLIDDIPIACAFNYSWSQTIYHKDDINISDKLLTKIAFKHDACTINDHIILALATTEINNFDNNSFLPTDDFIEVFNGTIATENIDGWLEIEFNQPYHYDGLNNLVVQIHDDSDITSSIEGLAHFYCSSSENYQSIVARNDYMDVYGENSYGLKTANYANMKLYYEDNNNVTNITLNKNEITFPNIGTYQSRIDSIKITNSSSINTVLNEINFSNNNTNSYELFETTLPLELPSETCKTIKIKFKNEQIQRYESVMSLIFSNIIDPINVNVTGEVVDFTVREYPSINDFEDEKIDINGWENINNLWELSSEAQSGEQAIRTLETESEKDAILQSPPYILPENIEISFWWKDAQMSPLNRLAEHDTTYFEISKNNRQSWETLSYISLTEEEQTDLYFNEIIHILDNNTQPVFFRFRDSSDGSWHTKGCGIDNFKITEFFPNPNIEIDTNEINESINIGTTKNVNIEISNNGNYDLQWQLDLPTNEERSRSFGDFLLTIPTPGNILPYAAAWDNGNIWISDVMAENSNTLTKIDLEGNIVSTLDLEIDSWMADFDAQDPDYLYALIVNPVSTCPLHKINKTTGEITEIHGEFQREVSHGLAFNKDANEFWISGWFQPIIYHIDAEGNTLSTLNNNDFQDITGMEWYANGNNGNGSLLIMQRSPNNILEINPENGEIINQVSIGEHSLSGLSLDNNNNIYGASMGDGEVYQIENFIYENDDEEEPHEVIFPDWLSSNSIDGSIAPHESFNLTLCLGGDDIEIGSYSTTMTITSNDTDNENISIPISCDIHAVTNSEDVSNINLYLDNYPNPFNPETTISFSLKENSDVSLDIYNIKGQKVKSLINSNLNSGSHSIIWNGKDNNNKSVSSGVYFYKLKSSSLNKTKKMILLK